MLTFVLTFVLVGTWPVAAAAQSGTTEGRIVVGVRNVDVGGERAKYREDLDLEGGPRIMGLDVTFLPEGEWAERVDRIHLAVDDLGGEPFESLRFQARRSGRFDFRYERHASDYFYEDRLFAPEEVSVRNARAGDFHTFDIRRVRDRATLSLTVSERAELTLGFDRYARDGRSTRPLSFERDEFELERPVEESSFQTNAAFRYRWDRVSVTIEERYEEFETANTAFLPGRSLGAFPEDQTVLDRFRLVQPHDLASWTHALRVVATPSRRLTLRVAGTLQTSDLGLGARETSSGSLFSGAPFARDASGDGTIERTMNLWTLDGSYLLGARWALIAGYSWRSQDQEGAFLFDEDPRTSRWDIRTHRVEGGVRWAPSAFLDVSGGVLAERRALERGAEEGTVPEIESEESGHSGFFGSVGWRPAPRLRLSLRAERSSVDDPLSLASATDQDRVRGGVRYSFDTGVWLSGSFQRTQMENEDSGVRTDHGAGSLRAGYQSERVQTQAGYSRVMTDREYDAEVIGTFGPSAFFAVDYSLASDIADGRLRVRVGDRASVGGRLLWYRNVGSFEVSRRDLELDAEYAFARGFLLRLGVRRVDYEEGAFDLEDYDAAIFDLGIGYAW